MEITLRDGDYLTTGDMRIFRAGYSLYRVDNANYTLIGSYDPPPNMQAKTFTFSLYGQNIIFPPVEVKFDDEELWKA